MLPDLTNYTVFGSKYSGETAICLLFNFMQQTYMLTHALRWKNYTYTPPGGGRTYSQALKYLDSDAILVILTLDHKSMNLTLNETLQLLYVPHFTHFYG